MGFALLGLGILLTTTLPDSFQYYVTVSELKTDPEKYQNTEIKLAGQVVPETTIHDTNKGEWRFDVFHEDQVISVFYKGPMPDTFNDEAEVVLTGTYLSNEFVATHVLAKCASRYEEQLHAPLEAQGNNT